MSRRISLTGLGFHYRLLLPALVLISLAVFLVAYFANSMVQGFVQKRFHDRIDFLASYVARNAELGILIKNRQMLQEMAENLLQESDVARIRILGADGQELAAAGQSPSGEHSLDFQAPVTVQELSDQSVGLPEAELDLAREADIIGQVVITSTMHGLERLQHEMQGRFLLVALGVACTAMIVFYLLSRSLVAPISRLAQTAQDVARGERNTRAVPDSIPETRKLALAFNSMLDSLEWSAQALEEAYQDMMQQQTLAELGRFAMTIAHEVKNPLGIIKSSLDMLKKEQGLTSQDMLVGYIEDEIQRLNRLIEDFLLFSKPAKATQAPVEMGAFLLDTVQRFEMQFGTEGVQIQIKVPEKEAWILGDKDLLTRAIHNLLKNGVEATDYHGTVRVWAQVQGDTLVVGIADQGPGIEPGIEDRIFEPFYTTRSQGTGLGLAYVSQVVTAHKGRIQVGNMQDQGAEFRVYLPLLGSL
ncbi:MAG: ATP-binding protein [Desulfovermiculus sp.]|nr:ATP-binding protein [Desulfovermiculus sp.]